MINYIKKIISQLISPASDNEDLSRRGLILNILLLFSIGGFLTLNIVRVIDVLSQPHDRGLPLVYTFTIFIFFIFLFWLSKKGYIKTASWLFLIIYSLPMFYCFITWGTDLPAALLLAVLITVLAGSLINDYLVLVSAGVISLFLIGLTYLQNHGLVAVNHYWLKEKYEISDAIAHDILLLIIASVAWLFCLEIGRALRRARKSETALRQERDSLEVRVEERTQQLRRAEAEKLNQLYRLAEFGRLSSGIFHDLLNPLTAISLNLEQINNQANDKIVSTKSYLNQALLAAYKMEGLISGIRKQIQLESRERVFSINKEIRQIVQILSYKARQARVQIEFTDKSELKLYGDPIKFGQIISNLLANAIETSEESYNLKKSGSDQEEKIKTVKININQEGENVLIIFCDQGAGISPQNISKIFEPFFSTKTGKDRGLGLGLASAKNIIEKNFKGRITVESELNKGSVFTAICPLNYIIHEN